jgi:hypothetical protein
LGAAGEGDGNWRKLHNEKLHNHNCSQHNFVGTTKSIGTMFKTRREEIINHSYFRLKNLRKETALESLNINVMAPIKLVLEEQFLRKWT